MEKAMLLCAFWRRRSLGVSGARGGAAADDVVLRRRRGRARLGRKTAHDSPSLCSPPCASAPVFSQQTAPFWKKSMIAPALFQQTPYFCRQEKYKNRNKMV